MNNRRIVLSLINQALVGELELKKLYKAWPEEVQGDEFYEEIYDDIERVVEHTPRSFVRDGKFSFESSMDYVLLKLDELLLASSYDKEKLKAVKQKIINEEYYKENLEYSVKKALKEVE